MNFSPQPVFFEDLFFPPNKFNNPPANTTTGIHIPRGSMGLELNDLHFFDFFGKILMEMYGSPMGDEKNTIHCVRLHFDCFA